MRTLGWLILGLFSFNSAVAEQIVNEYEHDIDQQIVKVFPVDKSINGALFVYKKYLEQRKSLIDPERSKLIVYEIKDTALAKTVPFLTIGSTDKHEIGEIARVIDGYLIPVIRGGNLVELYKYDTGKQAVQKINLPNASAKYGRSEKIFSLTDGYITVGYSDLNPSATFYTYNNSTKHEIDLHKSVGNIFSVDDVTELNGRVYIAGTSAVANGEDASNAWIYSIDKQFSKSSIRSYFLEIGESVSNHAEFIESLHSFPSVQVLSRKSKYSPQTVRIFKLLEKPEIVWQLDLDKIEESKNIAIAGVCKDGYVIAQIGNIKSSPASKGIVYREIGAKGEEKRVWAEEIVTGGFGTSIYLHPTSKYLFSLANYNKTESVRRQDGWYSWMGYRVDKYTVSNECI